MFEAFYNSLKPVTMVDYKLPIEASGSVSMYLECGCEISHFLEEGITEIPFEFLLKPLEGQGNQDLQFFPEFYSLELHESYHGVYVNISYMLNATVIRKYFGKDMEKSLEFIVELEVCNL